MAGAYESGESCGVHDVCIPVWVCVHNYAHRLPIPPPNPAPFPLPPPFAPTAPSLLWGLSPVPDTVATGAHGCSVPVPPPQHPFPWVGCPGKLAAMGAGEGEDGWGKGNWCGHPAHTLTCLRDLQRDPIILPVPPPQGAVYTAHPGNTSGRRALCCVHPSPNWHFSTFWFHFGRHFLNDLPRRCPNPTIPPGLTTTLLIHALLSLLLPPELLPAPCPSLSCM